MTEFAITITDDDIKTFQSEKSPKISVLGKNDDDDNQNAQVLKELFPKIITKKLEKMIPDHYGIAEITMTIGIQGNALGQKLSGQVQVKFSPKPENTQ
ncbi:hypothetical protein [Marinibactrum halimedae]|uniref:Uncharacterized protein n=1 Tax=Marinibactrum halimedae TaxID=1444977 RepID=A0AA37T7A8_9GAMM|nr:hypothetical protein [Marinibactrum halimedae]MCD9459099.1 hypothetical protein [Marinibactrum halimedae]GLS24700.1 hypothetical protein GCM10007877_04140 [Marinibactrum halimedae]